MAEILEKGGVLYLAVPVGRERVEYNSHRIFDPHTLLDIAAGNSLFLEKLAYVKLGMALREASDMVSTLAELAKSSYSLAIFKLRKQ